MWSLGLGLFMFSLCEWVFSGTPTSSHCPKTWIWGKLGTLKCPSGWGQVRMLVYLFYVALWLTGDLSRVWPHLCLQTAGTGPSTPPSPPRVTQSAGISGNRKWMNSMFVQMAYDKTFAIENNRTTERCHCLMCSAVHGADATVKCGCFIDVAVHQ